MNCPDSRTFGDEYTKFYKIQDKLANVVDDITLNSHKFTDIFPSLHQNNVIQTRYWMVNYEMSWNISRYS